MPAANLRRRAAPPRSCPVKIAMISSSENLLLRIIRLLPSDGPS